MPQGRTDFLAGLAAGAAKGVAGRLEQQEAKRQQGEALLSNMLLKRIGDIDALEEQAGPQALTPQDIEEREMLGGHLEQRLGMKPGSFNLMRQFGGDVYDRGGQAITVPQREAQRPAPPPTQLEAQALPRALRIPVIKAATEQRVKEDIATKERQRRITALGAIPGLDPGIIPEARAEIEAGYKVPPTILKRVQMQHKTEIDPATGQKRIIMAGFGKRGEMIDTETGQPLSPHEWVQWAKEVRANIQVNRQTGDVYEVDPQTNAVTKVGNIGAQPP